MNKKLTKTSKFISLVLRHDPSAVGITLDAQGWADVGELLVGLSKHGHFIFARELEEIVAQDEKKRYSFNDDWTKIRANQGHSIEVDLGLTAKEPPNVLFHGTAVKSTLAIMTNGIKKMDRQHVHLSREFETAMKVGSRHGGPVVFTVDAKKMHQDGFQFFESENGVWLTDHVPIAYLMETGETGTFGDPLCD